MRSTTLFAILIAAIAVSSVSAACIDVAAEFVDKNLIYIDPKQDTPQLIKWKYIISPVTTVAANLLDCVNFEFYATGLDNTNVLIKKFTGNQLTGSGNELSYPIDIDQAVDKTRYWSVRQDSTQAGKSIYYYQFFLKVLINGALQQTWRSAYDVTVDINLSSVTTINVLPEDLATWCYPANGGGCRGLVKASTQLKICSSASDKVCADTNTNGFTKGNTGYFKVQLSSTAFAATYKLGFSDLIFQDNGELKNRLSIKKWSIATQESNSAYYIQAKLVIANTQQANKATLSAVSTLEKVGRILDNSRYLASDKEGYTFESIQIGASINMISFVSLITAFIFRQLF